MHRLVSLVIAAGLGLSGFAVVADARPAAVPAAPVAPVAVAPVAPPAAGSPTPATAPAEAAAAVEEVFVVGDSLTVGVEPWLAGDMASHGVRLVGVDARVSRPVDEGLAVLRSAGERLPSTVVVALGTNNLSATRTQIEGWLRTARQLVGDRRLIWVNLSVDLDKAPHLDRFEQINAAIAAAAPRYGIEVADWDRWSADYGVTTRPDGIHYEDRAYRLRAWFYAEAVAQDAEE
jgi:hypothetical protein